MNIYDLERFKELPYELQDMIAHYTHEGYNLKWFNYNWYRIINDIGSNRGWDFIIDLLNHFISSKKSVCRNKNMIGHCKINTCQEFITCDDKLSIGYYYDYVGSSFEFMKKRSNKTWFWEDERVDNNKASKLIINRIDEYIYSNIYDPSILYIINKELLSTHYRIEHEEIGWSEDDNNSYSEEHDTEPQSWYNGWDSD
tara:strand:+ start:194 stop:787 length:594 start_codon:yes stop_codon:yes gene_type:complete